VRAHGGDGGEGVGLHLLATEGSAHPEGLTGHLGARQPEQARADLLRLARVLRRGVDEEVPRLVEARDAGVGLEVEVLLASDGEEPDSLVFTGSMDWMPNEDGIFRFVKEVLPLIRIRHPATKLWVVGRKPSNRIKALAESDTHIKVTGRVEDVRPYIAKGAVYIVPLRVGSGTRLKIFEAMAMGKAVVSTTIGAEGLPVTSGADVILADESRQFADAVCDLLQSPRERNRIGSAARTLVEEKYSWAAAAKHVDAVLQSDSLRLGSTTD